MFVRSVAAGIILVLLAACGAAAPNGQTPSPAIRQTAVSTTGSHVSANAPGAATPPVIATTGGRAAWPACAALADQRIEAPRSFAPGFPFPDDIRLFRFTTESHQSLTQLQVVGITSLGLREADGFIQTGLASAGYRLTGHDTESTEADGLFMGNGWIGSYKVSVFDDCEQATTWTVQVLKL
jgi:hypothetical protein